MALRSFATTCVLLSALLMVARPTHADWLADGVPIAVYNCAQLPTSTISDGHGGAYVCWTDDRNCSTARAYIQHLLVSGTPAPGWPAGGLRVSLIESGQGSARAVSDGADGAIVLWGDARTGQQALFAQRFSPDGLALWTFGGIRVCATSGNQIGARIVSDASGGGFVAWMDRRRNLDDGFPHHHPLYDVYAQRVGATGLLQWAPEGVPVDTSGTDEEAPSLFSDGASGLLVTWTPDAGPTRLQHFRPNGSIAFPGNGKGIAGRFAGIETADGQGGIVSAFAYGPDTQEDLWAQRVDSTGTNLWPLDGVLVESAAYGQRPNAIIADGTGGAFIASYDLRNGVDWNIYLQRITTTGAASSGWPPAGRPVCLQPGFQIYPTMIADGAGGVVLAWYDARDTADAYDIYAQRFAANGAFAPGWNTDGVRLCGATGDQVEPMPVPDGSGGALVVWSDYRLYADVYAQRVSGSGIAADNGPVTGVGESPGIGLALGPAFPNPAAHTFAVTFSAPGMEPASLALIDARGRTILGRIIPRAESGRMSFSADELRTLRSGVYLLRLTQGRRSVTEKVSIVR